MNKELAPPGADAPKLLEQYNDSVCVHGTPSCGGYIHSLVVEHVQHAHTLANDNRSVEERGVIATNLTMALLQDVLATEQLKALVHGGRWREARWFLTGWVVAASRR